METLEQSRVCRLCGKQAGLTVKIFDKRENHVKKINSVLPIVVHEMDLLPKHMCHTCNLKLHDFHKFYEDCLKTDAHLKSQLSWMQSSDNREEIVLPMVQISNVHIKSEPVEYDEQQSTEVMLDDKKLTDLFVQKNSMTLTEMALQQNGPKCSRCGCYCGNRSRDGDKSCTKTRPVRHNGVKKNHEDFSTRETIRRNLFATEIFGDKNTKIQAEIPMCSISRDMLTSTAEINGIAFDASMKRFDPRQYGTGVKNVDKMAADSRIMKLRTLRPRKRVNSIDLSNSIPLVCKTIKKSRSNLKINTEVNNSNTRPIFGIKLETPEALGRSLRPRMEVINYAESKRKNPMARVDVLSPKIGSSPIRIKIEEHLKNQTKTKDVEIPIAVKAKVQQFTGTSKNPKNSNDLKASCLSRQNNKKLLSKASDKVLNITTSNDTSFAKCSHRPNVRSHGSENKILNLYKQKNSETNHYQPSFYLRSQRAQLRSGKLKQFHSFVQKPKKVQRKNISQIFSGDADKRKRWQKIDESSGIILKYRICNRCDSRFASTELYMLHGCYANQGH